MFLGELRKNKYLVVSILLLVIAFGWFYGDTQEVGFDDIDEISKEDKIGEEKESKRTWGKAIKSIEVEGKGINQEVYPVGVTEDGYIETRDNAEDLVWYEHYGEGVRNVIIAGHRAWGSKKGVLYESETWEKGTKVIITFSDGSIEVFVHTKKYKYRMEDTPIEIMDTENGEYRITIMTCTGEYVKGYGHLDRVYNIFEKEEI